MHRPTEASAAVAIFASVNDAGADTAIAIERDVYLIPGAFPEGRQPDGNSVVLLAPKGLVVIDTGRHATHTQQIAGRKLAVHLEHDAATAGDVWLEDPATHLVVSGDLVPLPVPFFDTACPTQWQTALSHIAAVPFKTLVPGHGKPMSPQQSEAYRHAFAALLSCRDSKQPTSVCALQWLDNAGALIDPDDRSRVGPTLDYYMRAVLRAPASELTYRCAGGKS